MSAVKLACPSKPTIANAIKRYQSVEADSTLMLTARGLGISFGD